MSVELRPLGVKCNIECQYCYQNPQRDAGNVLHKYDFEKMKAGVEKAEGPLHSSEESRYSSPRKILKNCGSGASRNTEATTFKRMGRLSMKTTSACSNNTR